MTVIEPDLVVGLDWNPSFPEQVGVERVDAGYQSALIDSAGVAHALTFVAQHTGHLSAVELYGLNSASQLGEAFYNRFRPVVAEIYPGTDIYHRAIVDGFWPIAITASNSVFNENRTPATYDRLQHFPDQLWLFSGALNHFFRAWFNLGGWPDGRRVLNVRLLLRVNANLDYSRVDSDGSSMWRRTAAIATGSFIDHDVRLGEILVDNTSYPGWTGWTPSMLREFAPGGPRHWFVRCRAAAGKWAVRGFRIEVLWCPETRIGVGYQHPVTGFGWTRFALADPTGAGNPVELVEGQTYTLVVRRPYPDNVFAMANAVMDWRQIRGRIPDDTWRSYPVRLANTQLPATMLDAFTPLPVPVDPPPVQDMAMCARFLDTNSEQTPTSQPYSLGRGVQLWSHPDPSDPLGPTRLPRRLVQIIPIEGAAVATTYGMTNVVLGWLPGAEPRDEAEVEVTVYPAGEATPVLAPVRKTFGEIRRTAPLARYPTGEGNITYRYIRFRHEVGVPLAAGDYRVLVEVFNVNATRPLYVETLISADWPTSPAQSFDPTWAGAIGHAEGTWRSRPGETPRPLSGLDPLTGLYNSSDAQITISYVPPKITDVVTTDEELEAHTLDCCAGSGSGRLPPACAEGEHPHPCTCEETSGVPYVGLRWAEAIDRETHRYEIQRSDAYDQTWVTVAVVRGIINNHWEDFEARIGVENYYRIRAVRPSEVAGDWSDVATIAPHADERHRVALSFTSNVDLQLLGFRLGCAYPEVWDDTVEREFSFQEYDEVSLMAVHGRHRQVAFHRVERLGVQFSRTVLLSAVCAVRRPSMELYDPLRTISWAALPYVCVRDGDGNRWLANVQVPTARNDRTDAGDFWYGDVLVTEVATQPHLQDLPFTALIPQNLLGSDDMASFEGDTIVGWQLESPAMGTLSLTTITMDEGYQSLMVTPTDPEITLVSDPVFVEGGKPLRVLFSDRAEQATLVRLDIDYRDDTGTVIDTETHGPLDVGSTDWTRPRFETETPEGTASVVLRLHWGPLETRLGRTYARVYDWAYTETTIFPPIFLDRVGVFHDQLAAGMWYPPSEGHAWVEPAIAMTRDVTPRDMTHVEQVDSGIDITATGAVITPLRTRPLNE